MSILNFSVFVSVFLGFKLLFNYDEEKVITFCFFVVLFFLVNTLSDGISEHLKTQIQIVDMEFRKLLERKQVVISDLIKLNILINGFNNFIIKFFSWFMSEFRLVIQTKIKFISYSYTALVNDQLKSLVLLQNQQKENYTLLMFRQVVDQLIYQTNVNNLLSVNDSLFFDFNLESFENNLLLHSVETKKLFLITYWLHNVSNSYWYFLLVTLLENPDLLENYGSVHHINNELTDKVNTIITTYQEHFVENL